MWCSPPALEASRSSSSARSIASPDRRCRAPTELRSVLLTRREIDRFFARGLLRTIAIQSLEIRDVAVAPSGRGGWWADSGIIYYAPVNNTGIMKVPSGGGTPSAVTTLDRSKGEISHRWPQVLPGGKAILLTVWTGPARDNKAIQVLKLDTGSRETVANGGDTGRYVRSGHVLFGRLDADGRAVRR